MAYPEFAHHRLKRSGNQVNLAVVVKIARDQRSCRGRLRHKLFRLMKCAVSISQEYEQSVGSTNSRGNYEIELAVMIHIGDYVAEYPALISDTEMILKLIQGEFLARLEREEAPDPGFYMGMFPHLAEEIPM